MKKTMRGLPAHLELDRKLGESPIDYLMLNLRGPCNYRCRKCFADNPPTGRIALDWRRTSEVIREAHDMGARVVVIAGEGEPLMASTFQQVVRLNAELGLITIIFTNGTRLNAQMIAFLKDHDCSLIISCDSLKKDLYRSLTRCQEGHFDEVMANIETFRREFAKTAENRGGLKIVRGAINMVVTALAEDELPKMREFCGDDLLLVCNSIAPRGDAAQAWQELCGSPKDFARLREKAARFSETGGFSALAADGKCAYLYHGVAIGSDGSILPCAYTQDLTGALGDIREMDLREALGVQRRHMSDCVTLYGPAPCIVRHERYDEIVERTAGSPRPMCADRPPGAR